MDAMPRGQAHVDCILYVFFLKKKKGFCRKMSPLCSALGQLCELANMNFSLVFLCVFNIVFFVLIFDVDVTVFCVLTWGLHTRTHVFACWGGRRLECFLRLM